MQLASIVPIIYTTAGMAASSHLGLRDSAAAATISWSSHSIEFYLRGQVSGITSPAGDAAAINSHENHAKGGSGEKMVEAEEEGEDNSHVERGSCSSLPFQ